MAKLDSILQDIAEYISEKQAAKKWQPGVDTVQYAGPFFDENEYIASIETLLDGWLVLGQKGLNFDS